MKGFSLLEIMVVVAIIGIMASSVVIGFNSFGETVRTQETAGVITDTLKNFELEMIRRDYVKQTIHFAEQYLVAEAQVESQTLDLEWNGQGACPAGEEELKIINSASPAPVYLAQRDQYGNNIEINAFTGNTDTVCIDFTESGETEWQYQLFTGSDRSQIIRFIHFNIRRGDSEIATIQGNNITLEMTAPYASKEFLIDGSPPSGPVEITVQNGGDPVTITLQK